MAALRLKKKRIPGAAGAIVILPEGDLVAATCSQFERYLHEVLGSRVRGVAIDLANVGYMSSSAVGILIECVDRAREGRGWFGLVGANEPVRSAIEVLGLVGYLHLSATLDDLLVQVGVQRPKRRAASKPAGRRRKKR